VRGADGAGRVGGRAGGGRRRLPAGLGSRSGRDASARSVPALRARARRGGAQAQGAGAGGLHRPDAGADRVRQSRADAVGSAVRHLRQRHAGGGRSRRIPGGLCRRSLRIVERRRLLRPGRHPRSRRRRLLPRDAVVRARRPRPLRRPHARLLHRSVERRIPVVPAGLRSVRRLRRGGVGGRFARDDGAGVRGEPGATGAPARAARDRRSHRRVPGRRGERRGVVRAGGLRRRHRPGGAAGEPPRHHVRDPDRLPRRRRGHPLLGRGWRPLLVRQLDLRHRRARRRHLRRSQRPRHRRGERRVGIPVAVPVRDLRPVVRRRGAGRGRSGPRRGCARWRRRAGRRARSTRRRD
jgi:hypothetical protein